MPFAMGIIASALLGLIMGSFSSMASYRIPRGKNIIVDRSHCPKCNHVLGFWDLFPVLSWIVSRGRCRYCHSPIASSYILHEITLAVLFAVYFWIYGYSALTLITWAVTLCLVIIIAIDLEHYFIPDAMQVPLFILGIFYAIGVFPSFLEPVFALVLFSLLGLGLRFAGYIMKKVEALGWGDVKFIGIAGLFLGLDLARTALFFIVAGIAGIITALIWKKLGKGKFFPFGPALAVALLANLLIPDIQQFTITALAVCRKTLSAMILIS